MRTNSLIGVILAAFAAFAALPLPAASPRKPVIGVSASHPLNGSSSVGDSYIRSIENAGGVPLIIPMTSDSLELERVVSVIDGLVMVGGEDVNPARYGEKPVPEMGTINEPRDTFDLSLARIAVRNGLPVLGICRGSQVINVALGGTLWQDIPSQIPGSLSHRHPDKRSVKVQKVAVNPDSYMRTVVGADTLGVNSIHHQAVKRAASGLAVVGRTSDGVVEIYEGFPMTGKVAGKKVSFPQVVGVQSHPEEFAKDREQPYLSIYQDLVFRASAEKRLQSVRQDRGVLRR